MKISSSTAFTIAALVGTAHAFTSTSNTAFQRHQTALNGGARGGATTPAGKAKTVEVVTDLLDKSEMIFTIPASSLTVSQVSSLRRSLPEGTTAKVVKNKLMARAIQENASYESLDGSSLMKGANMWFFVEDDISGSLKAVRKFIKESGKVESHTVLGGVIDGDLLDESAVKQVENLPSKIELIARIAGGIKAVPTKLGRVVKAPNSKLARAIKLATDKNNGVEE